MGDNQRRARVFAHVSHVFIARFTPFFFCVCAKNEEIGENNDVTLECGRKHAHE